MGHSHEPGHTSTTVVEERTGPSAVLIAVIDRTPDTEVDQTNIEQQEETDVNVPSDTDQPTNAPTENAPSPSGSP